MLSETPHEKLSYTHNWGVFSHLIFTLLFSLPPSLYSDPGSNTCSRVFSLPTTASALHFFLEKVQGLSSLVDSGRVVPTQARRS